MGGVGLMSGVLGALSGLGLLLLSICGVLHMGGYHGRLLSMKEPAPDKYTRSGIYKLTCQECNKAYVDQTGWSFYTRYTEHKKAFKNNSHTSNFAKHLHKNAHPFGTIQKTMQILE
jgi:hypothetical protein